MWLPEDEVFFNKDSKLPSNLEELLKFYELLQSQRNDLLRILPVIFSTPPQLDILHLWTYSTRHVQVHDKGYRKALDPSLFDAFTKEAVMGPEFQLTLPLNTGENKWGQVWKGKIKYNGKEADVAVKLYIQSLFPWPDTLEEVQQKYWATSPLQARNEAWAYAHMHSLQGREVPRSLGFFQCALPTGEIAFAHVMEFVRGVKADEISLKDCSPEMKINIADSAASGIFNIGACGFLHGDFYGGNILIRDDFLPPVCFVDFSVVKDFDHASNVQNMIGIVYILRRAGIEMVVIKQWLEKRRKDNPVWFNLIREIEENPDPADWLVMIESKYGGSLYST